MEIRPARDSELQEVVELQCRVFLPEPERYWSYLREDPSYRPHQSRIIFDKGRIMAHLRVWHRIIQVRGARLRAGGIGGVVTHPEFRRQGYATALMQDAHRYLEQQGYDLGLLFSIIGTGFYESLGWTPLELPVFTLPAQTDRPVASPSGVRALNPEADLESVAAIHEACTRDWNGPVVRTDSYWKSGPSRYRRIFPGWGVEQEGALAAYLNLEKSQDRIWVREACASPGAEAAYRQLSRWICRELESSGLRTVAGSLPHDHALVEYLSRDTGSEARWTTHEEMMVKLINWPSLARKLWAAELPMPRSGEAALLETLFGVRPAPPGQTPWSSLPPGKGLFYWWSEIF